MICILKHAKFYRADRMQKYKVLLGSVFMLPLLMIGCGSDETNHVDDEDYGRVSDWTKEESDQAMSPEIVDRLKKYPKPFYDPEDETLYGRGQATVRLRELTGLALPEEAEIIDAYMWDGRTREKVEFRCSTEELEILLQELQRETKNPWWAFGSISPEIREMNGTEETIGTGRKIDLSTPRDPEKRRSDSIAFNPETGYFRFSTKTYD